VARKFRSINFAVVAPNLNGFDGALRRVLRVTRANRQMRRRIKINDRVNVACGHRDSVGLQPLKVPLSNCLRLNGSGFRSLVKPERSGQ